jgi:hypothetical protein
MDLKNRDYDISTWLKCDITTWALHNLSRPDSDVRWLAKLKCPVLG